MASAVCLDPSRTAPWRMLYRRQSALSLPRRIDKLSRCPGTEASRCCLVIADAPSIEPAGKNRCVSEDSLDFVELEMKAGGFLDFAVELKNPDFSALAESAAILGLKAETAQDVRPMLQKAFKHDGPALVEALVHRQELSMPSTITIEQATGFGMFMLKAVISGRGDELVDLAKVNLFR